jgi:hypothetical protein
MAGHRAYRRGKTTYVVGRGKWWTFNSVDSAEAWKDWYNARNSEEPGGKELLNDSQEGKVHVRLAWDGEAFSNYGRAGALLRMVGVDTDGVMLVRQIEKNDPGVQECVGMWCGLNGQGPDGEFSEERLNDLATCNTLLGNAYDPSDTSRVSYLDGWMSCAGGMQIRVGSQYELDPDPNNTWLVTTWKPGQTNILYGMALSGGGQVHYNDNYNPTEVPLEENSIRTKYSFLGGSPFTSNWMYAVAHLPGPFIYDLADE